jgi:hypothetical protein
MRRFTAVIIPIALLALTPMVASGHGLARSAAPGSVKFGESLKGTKLVHPTPKIPLGKSVAWSATFAKKAGTSKVTVKLIQTSGPGTHPAVVWTTKSSVKKSSTFAVGMLSAKEMTSKKLKYAKFELEYFAGNTLLASGKFQRLNCDNCNGAGGGY